MANILPPEAERLVQREYRARFMLVGSVTLILCSIFISAAILPTEISALLATPTPQTTPTPPGDVAKDSAAITQAQQIVSVLATLDASSSGPEFIAQALAVRPSGVVVTEVSYSFGEIVLSGSAPSPDLVNSYSQALQQNPAFTHVSLPLQALLSSPSGAFTMTLTGNF